MSQYILPISIFLDVTLGALHSAPFLSLFQTNSTPLNSYYGFSLVSLLIASILVRSRTFWVCFLVFSGLTDGVDSSGTVSSALCRN